jgi:hypothetical protein
MKGIRPAAECSQSQLAERREQSALQTAMLRAVHDVLLNSNHANICNSTHEVEKIENVNIYVRRVTRKPAAVGGMGRG